MRNLRNRSHEKFSFGEDKPSGLTATAWDASDDSLILAFGPTEHNPALTLKRLPKCALNGDEAIAIASWDAPSPHPDLPVDRILALHCFPDTKTLTLVLRGGDIVVVREEPGQGQDPIEIVGSVDEGITAAAWSPDEELLAVATGAGTLLFMTGDFESVSNITLSAEDLKVSNHVSVGWGKKETQFKGRGAAKALRDPTVPEHVDEGIASNNDDERVTISWRGDGQYLAMNSMLEVEPKRRVVRVYSREGVLESVSEPVNGLEGALAWKPSGQTIAGIQRRDEAVDVIFFERNGLRHGEFGLRLSSEEMTSWGASVDLRWNVDSTVLAVSMRDRVQLWTVGNYHWYLKQEIRFESADSAVSRTLWHPEKALQLCCNSAFDLRRLAYGLEIIRGSVVPPHDVGLVTVIDGKQLKITPLRTANVPPPMAFDDIPLPDNALDVAVNEEGTEIAVLHHELVSLWKCDYSSKPQRKAQLEETFALQPDDTRTLESRDLRRQTDHDRISFTRSTASDSRSNQPSIEASGSSSMTWRSELGEEIALTLSDSGVLTLTSEHQNLRIPSCTSHILTPWHLIYTTGQHLLKFVHLHDGNVEIPPDEPEKDERCRSIERGAKIVTVMPSSYALVLQMPRGNLETIYPRALVLAGVRQSIKDKDYKKAFATCRVHRVDMNILYDYAPEQFMRDVELFVKQVKKVDYVDLFLSSLTEEDVSKTLYRETLAPAEKPVVDGVTESPPHSHPSGTSKVNKICDEFLQVLQKQKSTRLQNIVTSHVCKNPPDLDSGLKLISTLRSEGDQERLEAAVEHICFLTDPNQLYDTSLGLYDLDVTLLVAQQSQKDPREYLPYLQSLQDMEPLRKRFTIDTDLKRHGKAIAHLHSLDAFDELKEYTRKHDLYNAAIELYRYDNAKLFELMRMYADFLSSRNRYKEAGLAYEYISDYTSALDAYRAVSMWQECLACASLIPVSREDLSSLAQDLAGSLEESKDFAAAAKIHLDYLDDLQNAATLLCKGYHFAEAIRLVALRQSADLLRSVIDPGLIESSASMTEMLAEMKTQIAAQVPRLRELRKKKAEDPMAFLDGADGGDADVPDNISLAPTDASTSGGTFMTRYTNRSTGTLDTNATRKTSKNRRREERKRARGKKGTVYEEEYLINSIARLIERLNSIGEDVGKLVEGLMRRTMRERAVAVQAAMDDVVEVCKSVKDEVFAANDNGQVQSRDPEGGEVVARPWGGAGVLWESLTAKMEAPVLKQFERLSLLP